MPVLSITVILALFDILDYIILKKADILRFGACEFFNFASNVDFTYDVLIKKFTSVEDQIKYTV